MLWCGETGDNRGKRIIGETRSRSVNEVGALVVLQNLLEGPSVATSKSKGVSSGHAKASERVCQTREL